MLSFETRRQEEEALNTFLILSEEPRNFHLDYDYYPEDEAPESEEEYLGSYSLTLEAVAVELAEGNDLERMRKQDERDDRAESLAC